MKKYISFLLTFILLFVLSSCKEKLRTIKIYNCVDYIDESVLDDFVEWYEEEYGQRIAYVYDTYETNESMYNTLRTGKTDYDVCCPSDYMIQKMIRENMLETFDFENYDLDIYKANCSPYILNLFEQQNWTNYAACYMWGTLGIIYNPEFLGEAGDVLNEDGNYEYDVNSWMDFLNPNFNNMISLKDSVRDSYCVASIIAYRDELLAHDNLDPSYNALIQDVINRTSDEAIEKAEKVLREIKPNIFGLEVDSGKGDIVTGKIAMNLAWSGDAVYSMDLAEEEDVELRYCVPVEGGNVWFDGWVMPKGADKQLAQAFINYLSIPEVARLNMEEIGYTSSIAGSDIFELVDEWYGRASNDLYVEELQAKYNELVKEKDDLSKKGKDIEKIEKEIEKMEKEIEEAIYYRDYEAEYETMDLTYFFNGTLDGECYNEEGRILIDIDTSYIGRQFTTQYPDEDTLNRCGVMEDFKEQNEKVLQMWINFKANKVTAPIIIGLVSFAVVVTFVIVYSKRSQMARKRRMKEQKAQNKN